MKNRRGLVTRIAISTLVLVVVLILLNWSKHESRDEKHLEVSKNAMKISSPQTEERSSDLVRKIREVEVIKKKETANFYKKKIEDLIKERENARSELLGEKEGTSQRGKENSYLLGIKRPTGDEVAAVRLEIANAMKECLDEERQELDKKIGKLIETYDPFGILGDRAALITVPQDPDHPIYAYVYPTTNFEAELSMLNRDQPFNFTFDNSKRGFQQSLQPGSKDYTDAPFGRFSLFLQR